MIKWYLLAVALFLNMATCDAQGDDYVTVTPRTKRVGTNLMTNAPIMVVEYGVRDRIERVEVDTLNECLTVQIRGLSKNGKWLDNKGHVLRYSNKEQRVLWSLKIGYQMESIEQFGEVILHSSLGKSYRLDNATGERIWEAKNSLIFADPASGIGFGYALATVTKSQNTLIGYDLMTGNMIWHREISREFSWNDVLYLNDSTILIVAAGLHAVNIHDGTGWDHHAVSGAKDYTAAAVGTGLGVVAGLLTGTYAVNTGHDLVRDLVSNVIIDSLSIYFASKEFIAKLDHKGQVLWKTALPSEMTSKSAIIVSGEDLLMINSGSAYMGYRRLDYGAPFIASFRTSDGEQNYLAVTSSEGKDHIVAQQLGKDYLSIMTTDRVTKRSTKDGSVILEKRIDPGNSGELVLFVGDRVFLGRDSMHTSLSVYDSSKHYLYTQSGKIKILNSEFDVEGELTPADYWIYQGTRRGLRFIAQNDRTIALDLAGRSVAEISASRRSSFIGDKLYCIGDSAFLEIDLAELLNSSP
ncbi:MAG: PQQ-binding-like beta-propeller repeat protein [Flavobacteriales bacterium]